MNEPEPVPPITPEAPAPDESPRPDAGDVDEPEDRAIFDVEEFVKALPPGVCLCPVCLGIGAIDEQPPYDPYVHRCTTCGGHGELQTGSLLGAEILHKCRDCDGKGWAPNTPGELPAAPARADDLSEGPARDYAGRTPDDAEFDWSRVVRPVESTPTEVTS